MAKPEEGCNKIRHPATVEKIIISMKGCVKSNTFNINTESDRLQLHHLPYDILRSILSRLTFTESSRMSLISHKWQRLWRSCCPKMVFNRATMFKQGSLGVRRTRTNFARRVNSFLKQPWSIPTLNKFYVKFGMRRKHACHVNKWIDFCSVSRASHVTIDFTPGMKGIIRGMANDKYILPVSVFIGPDGYNTHIKSLHLGYVCLNNAFFSFAGFINLKKLTLHKISFLGDPQCFVLPECTTLEYLSISCCSLSVLTTCQPLQRLQYLRLHYCHLEKLNLEAPNITSFDFTNLPIPFALGGSLKVVEANIKLLCDSKLYGDNLDYIYTELPATLHHVQKLSVTSNLYIYDELHMFARTTARFSNLRHLIMFLPFYGETQSIDGILRLAYLLELAPVLEELELHVLGDDVPARWALRGNITAYPHDRLKRVLISGACKWEGLMELAYYFLRSARLESMVIDPMMRVEGPPQQKWMVDAGRSIIKELFEKEEFQSILTIL